MIDKNFRSQMDTILNAKKYFEKNETNGDAGESLKDILVHKYKWSEQVVNSTKSPLVRIDVRESGTTFLAPHSSIVNTIGTADIKNTNINIQDILVPGGSIYFDSKSLKNAGFKSIFSKGMRAMDVANWHNFLKEGLTSVQYTKGSGPTTYTDLFDKWWLIRDVNNYKVQVENFQSGIIINFPNIIVTEPEYVFVRYPSEQDTESLINYNKCNSIDPADLMNNFNKIFRRV